MRVLVPLDGSIAAKHAFEHALWLTSVCPETVLTLLNVQNAETMGLSDIRATRGDETDLGAVRSDRLLKAPARLCRDRHISHETRAGYGGVAEVIIRVAREIGADQIVMGTRGLGPVRGLLLGSVATEVVRLSPIPVTLVKKSTRRTRPPQSAVTP